MEPENNNTNELQQNTVVHKKPTLTLPAAILTGLALIAMAIVFVAPKMTTSNTQKTAPTAEQQPTPTSIPADVAKARPTDHIKGDAAAAKVLLITYSDSDCPFCARFHPTVDTVLKDYGNKVAWVYRQFPLDIHPNAYTESMGLECAAKLGGDKAFFAYLDAIIGVTLNPDEKSNQALLSFASDVGLDKNAFKACFNDDAIADKIDADMKEAAEIGARGTPFSIAVNQATGKQVVIPGAYPIEKVKEAVDSLL